MKEETQENQMQTGELIKVLPVRYGYLDFWKYIAAIGVIFVHAPLPGVWETLWTTVGVCGVGFFYIITGFACCGPDKDLVCRKILKRLVRNGIITIITIAVYLAFAWIYSRHNHALYPLKRAMKLPVTYARMFLLGDFEFMCGASLFVLCINNPQRHLCRFVESCGRHDSLLVYLSHFLILIIVSELMYSTPHLPKHMDWIVPLTVAAVSLVFARIVSIVILHYYKCHCRA